MRISPLLLMILLVGWMPPAVAEDGYDLWLRYRQVESPWLERYRRDVTVLIEGARTPTLHAAQSELSRGLSGLLGAEVPRAVEVTRAGAVVFGTPASSRLIAALKLDLRGLGNEGYLIRSVSMGGHPAIVVAANTDIGALYGAFGLLRLLQTRQPLDNVDLRSLPRLRHRVLNHWDNLDGTVERGYAGASIWDWHKLPDYIDPRYIDYARANASLGINGAVLTNVNANAISLTSPYLLKTAALASALRPYGIKVFLTARFSAPIEIGGLESADPLDPRVRAWWKQKTDEIYRHVPDFGGFLVKANSEGQPGPQDYGRSHADGANMLAEAVGSRGIVMWRAFVYSDEQPQDRVKQAYSEFVPLDGKFRHNVLLQVKNGPLDFQPREPFHPLFGAMPRTPLMMELQITKEYLGFATHLAYLGPLYEEVLRADTHAQGPGSTVARVLDGSLHDYARTGMAGVANIGSDRNWSGSHFDQANWYTFGRLAWDPAISSKDIADEWVRMTFTNDPAFVGRTVEMMMSSRELVVDYMMPLGLHHLMARGHHYGPGPWVAGGPRADWTSVYYHRADENGIGFDRTRSGSNAVAQYRPPLAAQFSDVRRTPENYLLWFHRVPWDHRTASGRSLWDELVHRYSRGVAGVTQMRNSWQQFGNAVDAQRRDQIAAFLLIQENEARWWRDASIAYFRKFARRPIPAGYEPPAHSLDYYQSLSFPYAPGHPPVGTRDARDSPAPLLHALFQDRAVLQRDRPIKVWGKASPNAQLTVVLGSATVHADADATGKWTATLPAMPAGGPHSLAVRASTGERQTVDDVLIGDVWLCSGQSNMALQVHRALDARAEIAGSENGSIRMLTVPQAISAIPLDEFVTPVRWLKASPATTADFSAACFFFARELQKTVSVPMGLITSAWGGSKIETWTSRDALRAAGDYDRALSLVEQYGSDPIAARGGWSSVWEMWWRERTTSRAGEEPWSTRHRGEWRDAPVDLGAWERWGVPELANFNGMVWYRTRVRLTARQAAGQATLSLGQVDEVDHAWVNGRGIGSSTGVDVVRQYQLPSRLLKAGENVIVVNVLDTYGSGGLIGPAQQRSLQFADGSSVALDGAWQYQIAPSNLGAPPRAPWEATAGLSMIRNAMIAPLRAYGVRGVAWYQGEANTEQADRYQKLLQAFMADWRRQFGAELPFLIVQLANYGAVAAQPGESGWAALREAQRLAVAKDGHAALAIAVDIGDPYDIHPANKQEVGRRLARAARRVVYGESISLGPTPLSAHRVDDGIVVELGDVTGRLIAYGSSGPIGFELCGAEVGSCRYVSAHLQGASVKLLAPQGVPVTRVRYCWADSPVCTLFDEARLPAVPFELAIH